MQAIVENVAESVRAACAPWADDGVDIRAAAHQLSIEVRDVEMRGSGRLHLVGDSAVVELNAREPEVRRRFTLAHEIGHWVLRHPSVGGPRVREAMSYFRSEEVFCDRFAGALLMPAEVVRPLGAEQPREIHTVRALARPARVSQSAAFVRFRDLSYWQGVMVEWILQERRWILHGEAGLWPSEIGKIRTTEGTRMALKQLSACPGEQKAVYLPLSYAGAEATVEALVLAKADRAVAIFDLPVTRGSMPR